MDPDRGAQETQEMELLVSEEHKNAAISGEIATTSTQTAKLDKMTVAVIMTLIVGILFFIISQVINIYMKYKVMIRGIDNNKPSDWPTSGFFTALAVEYPGLAGIHFKNKSLPTAVNLCFNVPPFSTSTCFNTSTMQILSAMYNTSIEYNNMSAHDLICNTWGNSSSTVRDGGCVSACTSKADIAGMISGGVGMGSMGFFAGHAISSTAKFAGPLGALLGIGAGIGLSYLQSKQAQDAQNASANCSSSSSASASLSSPIMKTTISDSFTSVQCNN